jgi:hypothetical protein
MRSHSGFHHVRGEDAAWLRAAEAGAVAKSSARRATFPDDARHEMLSMRALRLGFENG